MRPFLMLMIATRKDSGARIFFPLLALNNNFPRGKVELFLIFYSLFLAVSLLHRRERSAAVAGQEVEEAKTTLIWCTMKMFFARAFIAIIYIFG